jgi:hypothetical protein
LHRREFIAASLGSLGSLTLPASISLAKPHTNFKFGVHLADEMTPAQFDALVGYPTDIIAKFLNFIEPFPDYLGKLVGPKGKTLAVYWETEGNLDDILRGSFDPDIRTFARAARNYGYPIILSPIHEMNLNEQAWGYSAVNTPEKYKDVWKKLRDALADASNITWGLGFNDDSIPSEYDAPDNSYESYYPGDEYVDYVGISAMKWLGGDRETFEQVVDSPYDPPIQGFASRLPRLKAFGKPIYIWETGCGYDAFEPTFKANYIRNMFSSPLIQDGDIAGLVWLQENKELDWRLNDNDVDLEAAVQGLEGL